MPHPVPLRRRPGRRHPAASDGWPRGGAWSRRRCRSSVLLIGPRASHTHVLRLGPGRALRYTHVSDTALYRILSESCSARRRCVHSPVRARPLVVPSPVARARRLAAAARHRRRRRRRRFRQGTDNSFSIPGTESQAGIEQLSRTFPQASGTSAQIIVVAADGATGRGRAVRLRDRRHDRRTRRPRRHPRRHRSVQRDRQRVRSRTTATPRSSACSSTGRRPTSRPRRRRRCRMSRPTSRGAARRGPRSRSAATCSPCRSRASRSPRPSAC